MNKPIRFEPCLRPVVWGGRALGEVLGKALPSAGPYGESWEVSDHPSHRSAVAGADGATLRDLMRDEPEALLGTSARADAFPWLVKYLDARDWLSVQVHPDDSAARHLWPGERGKTEAWLVLDAQPGARAYAGLKPGVDEEALRRALGEGGVADCLHSFEPRPGDCLFLPAGTAHAAGGGVLMAEVQQTSDATFRLFDWGRLDPNGRPRRLHVEEALACIDWRAGPVTPIRAEGYPQAGGGAPWSVRQRLVDCDYFRLEYLRQSEPFALGGGGMQVVMVLHGKGALHTGGGAEAMVRGDTLLLPHAMPEGLCRPEGSLGLLVASLPNVNR